MRPFCSTVVRENNSVTSYRRLPLLPRRYCYCHLLLHLLLLSYSYGDDAEASSLAFPLLALSLSSRSTHTTRATPTARPSFTVSLSLSFLPPILFYLLVTERVRSYVAHDVKTQTKPITAMTTYRPPPLRDPLYLALSLSLSHTPTKTHGRNTHARTQCRRNCWGRTTMVERRNRGFSCCATIERRSSQKRP